MRSLGLLYINGLGGKQDITAAILLFEMGALLNDVVSLYLLGKVYLSVEGANPDYKKVFQLAMMAAMAGLPDAMFQLGMCNYTGIEIAISEAEGNV